MEAQHALKQARRCRNLSYCMKQLSNKDIDVKHVEALKKAATSATPLIGNNAQTNSELDQSAFRLANAVDMDEDIGSL